MIAIRTEGLGKRYEIGARREQPDTLRDMLSDTLAAPLRLWRRGRAAPARRPRSDTFWALRNVSFEIKSGEILGIIGRNGAGKSTLLKILSRVTKPTEGRVAVYGRVASLLEVGTGFNPELTGRENVYLNGAILGLRKAEIDRKFDEIVAFSEIDRFIDTPVKRYSSGMHVRLGFAVAAQLDPEVLIVDEVLAVGDVAFQKKCMRKIEEARDSGRTILLVSHNMGFILQLCARCIWLEAGAVAAEGDPATVVSRYVGGAQPQAAGSLLDARVQSHGVAVMQADVFNDRGQARSTIPYADPFSIAVEYDVDRPIDGLRIGLRLHNERNIPVLYTATSDCASLDGRVGVPGRHCSRVRIPGAWLAPGHYGVELIVWSPQVKTHHRIANALGFEVVDAPVDIAGAEVLRPTLEWRVDGDSDGTSASAVAWGRGG
ncbi:MAG TPA: ABC transporter ATP-binding protein [Candidatus Margulisiibacteriota bacterium]|nr:ABC transporter ATP-binding protein [Candidatus Margulisiibacteriota bacterium]